MLGGEPLQVFLMWSRSLAESKGSAHSQTSVCARMTQCMCTRASLASAQPTHPPVRFLNLSAPPYDASDPRSTWMLKAHVRHHTWRLQPPAPKHTLRSCGFRTLLLNAPLVPIKQANLPTPIRPVPACLGGTTLGISLMTADCLHDAMNRHHLGSRGSPLICTRRCEQEIQGQVINTKV